MSKRMKRSTPQQFDAMVEFMNFHPQLISGKLSSSLTSAKRERLWEELASILNDGALGPKKTVHQWRRAWIDLKSEVKEKLGELEAGGQPEILNPAHQKVADLLTEVEHEVELNEKPVGQFRAKSISEIKFEDKRNIESEDDTTPTPIVVSISTNHKDKVYCESDSSNSNAVQEPVAGCSTSSKQKHIKKIISEAMETKAKKRTYRRTEVEENEHLNNLVLVEKEKSDMLSAIAHALSTTNEHEEKRLKIEQDRNALIQERNAIENERNELFKAFLEHMLAKSEQR